MKEYSARFRVHVFDVNCYNEAGAVTLLRFMQQAASDASAAAGYPPSWYDENGTLWLIRRSSLTVERAVRYHDELEIRTWVSDIRRVRSRRDYEIGLASGGAAIAHGSSDWVYVDLRTGSPIRPPAAMQAALMPQGVIAKQRAARRLLPPPGAFATGRRVELAAIDTVAHVNNAMYAAFLEQDLWDALAANGWKIEPAINAPHLQLVSHDIEYFRPAAYDDVLAGLVWTTEVRERGFRSAQVLRLGGEIAVTAESEWRWSDGGLPPGLERACSALRRAV